MSRLLNGMGRCSDRKKNAFDQLTELTPPADGSVDMLRLGEGI